MSSILTNTGAMVALQSLKAINADLAKTQSLISTGKSVGSAKDNAAIWAISKVMEADVQGFKGIADSLSLGGSTVAVARKAAETVTDLLKQMKAKIVSAQEENVDRAKIQTDIEALRDQIGSVVGAAQFNGLNLLSNHEKDAESGLVKVLASLDRSVDGVTASSITVTKTDLTTQEADFDGGTYAAGTGTSAVTLNATHSVDVVIARTGTDGGDVYSIGLTGTDADSSTFTPADYTTAGTVAGAKEMFYVTHAGDTAADIANGLAAAFAAFAAENELDPDVLNIVASGDKLVATSTVTDGNDTIAVRVDRVTAPTDVTIGGGLDGLSKVNVTTDAGARAALSSIESMIQTAVNSAAAFGSVEGRIDTQSDFVSSLIDSLRAGIGTLVDADMEEASARLQALQVQQQLGVQSLSIANQAPQSILSLFR
ncbi:MAG: flagellin [Rubellimicrobium sp.]|nr:flagellin [Rubellimicrobium sp.]